ncbi:MAG: hypothetical protein PVI76_02115, partial [Desulfobacterales bacterium]
VDAFIYTGVSLIHGVCVTAQLLIKRYSLLSTVSQTVMYDLAIPFWGDFLQLGKIPDVILATVHSHGCDRRTFYYRFNLFLKSLNSFQIS